MGHKHGWVFESVWGSVKLCLAPVNKQVLQHCKYGGFKCVLSVNFTIRNFELYLQLS